MEQPRYLVDTNALIDYLGNKLPASGLNFMNGVIDVVPNISVISKIEVLGFNTSVEHYKTLSDFINDATVFDLSVSVVEMSIEIRRKYKTKLPDAIIAATALVHALVLISRNISDFKNIDGLKVIDPHSL
ncbi:MAG: type II toxin-antitoxin system VapC family toxin [Ginsengibacter sp.]